MGKEEDIFFVCHLLIFQVGVSKVCIKGQDKWNHAAVTAPAGAKVKRGKLEPLQLVWGYGTRCCRSTEAGRVGLMDDGSIRVKGEGQAGGKNSKTAVGRKG